MVWLQDVKYVIAACSTNYNTQALSNVELVVVEALEIAANECLAMLVSVCVCVCVCACVRACARVFVCCPCVYLCSLVAIRVCVHV